ncbi:hypothetical protein M0R72_08030 [Candidatus Pacearchaeota archaeon]|nr:hypothetical protein [Candidatus Pacearchaeota archaeon]
MNGITPWTATGVTSKTGGALSLNTFNHQKPMAAPALPFSSGAVMLETSIGDHR